jgi:hypothetical protein
MIYIRRPSSSGAWKLTTLWASFLTGALILGITAYHNVQQSTLLVGNWASVDCQASVSGSTSDANQFSIAYRESLGFFDDIPEEDWELMRNITLGRVNNDNPLNPLLRRLVAPEWYQKNWDPDFSCRHDTKVGVGDGAKVCMRELFVIVCLQLNELSVTQLVNVLCLLIL